MILNLSGVHIGLWIYVKVVKESNNLGEAQRVEAGPMIRKMKHGWFLAILPIYSTSGRNQHGNHRQNP